MMDEAPKYKVIQDSFIEPWFIKAGKIIEFDGEPGPHLEALNAPAEEMMAAYYKAHPDASLFPLERLPMTVGANPTPVMKVVGDAAPDEIISFVDMSDKTGRGGKAKVTSLAEAKASSPA